MSFLKSLAKSGVFGVAGLAATHKLGGLARAGVFGIGGALLAGKKHQDPNAMAPPRQEDFADPTAYLTAVQQWAQGHLTAMQPGQQAPGIQMPLRPTGIAGALVPPPQGS